MNSNTITYADLHGGGEFYSLEVQDDSMDAVNIHKNDTIIFRKQPIVNNEEIAVILTNENVLIRKFKQENNKIYLFPLSNNANYQVQTFVADNPRIKVIGKVIECKRDIC